MFRGDIGIKDDEIKKIGELHNERAEKEIDASGKLVTPGFIDVNNHSDTYWRIFDGPQLESLVCQGITTIVGGNCGSSLAPLFEASDIATIQKWIDLRKVNVNWLSMEEFLKVLKEKKLALNFGTLAGHGTIRRGILKDEERSFKYGELKLFYKTLECALKDGALGMSTGLIYTHARMADIDELVELAKIVKKYNGVYTTHIRSERDWFINAIEETVQIGRVSGAKIHISHLKVMGEKNWEKMDEALSLIEKAREDGMDVTFDVYPYTNTGSVLYTLLPDWVAKGGKKMMLSRLKDPAIRGKVISEMRESKFDFDKVEIASSLLNKTLARRKISEIAASQEKGIEEAIIDLLIASEGRVISSMEVLSARNVEKAIAHPLSIISTNGAGYDLDHKNTGEVIHARNFGTFPKVLRDYVVGKSLLSWEEAIKKMTSAPAGKFGFKKRGVIREGNYADILVINPETIDGPATKENPYQYAKGIDNVLVNGKVIVGEGSYNGEMAGRVIRR